MFLHVDQTLSVQTWTIDRADRQNSVGTSLADELAAATAKLRAIVDPWAASAEPSAAPAVRVLILTAASVTRGDSATWVAGGDLKELAKLDSPQNGAAYAAKMSAVCRALEQLRAEGREASARPPAGTADTDPGALFLRCAHRRPI